MVEYYVCICVFRTGESINVVVTHDEHCVRTFRVRFVVALGHTAELLSKRRFPHRRNNGVLYSFFVAGISRARHRMYCRAHIVFEVAWALGKVLFQLSWDKQPIHRCLLTYGEVIDCLTCDDPLDGPTRHYG